MLSIPVILTALALVAAQVVSAGVLKPIDTPKECLHICAPVSNAQSFCVAGFDNSATRMACLCKDLYLEALARCLTCEADPSITFPAGSTRPTLENVQKLSNVLVNVCHGLGLDVHPIHIKIPKPSPTTTSTAPPAATTTGSASGSGSDSDSGTGSGSGSGSPPAPAVVKGDDGDDQKPLKPSGGVTAKPKPTKTDDTTTTTTPTTTPTATTTTPAGAKATGTKLISIASGAKPTKSSTDSDNSDAELKPKPTPSSSATPPSKAGAPILSVVNAAQDGLDDSDDGISTENKNGKKTNSAGRGVSIQFAPYVLAAVAMIAVAL